MSRGTWRRAYSAASASREICSTAMFWSPPGSDPAPEPNASALRLRSDRHPPAPQRPDASNFARPAVISTALRMRSLDMLSRSTISAPLSRASASCSSVSTSTSIGIVPLRARFTASPTPPAAATWLSLMRIASHSPARWLWPPPARTAARSSERSPGVVLRVSSRVTFGNGASASAYRRVSVAMPERRCRKLRAVRSPVSREPSGPTTFATSSSASSRAPSGSSAR